MNVLNRLFSWITIGSGPPYTLADCIEVMGGFYIKGVTKRNVRTKVTNKMVRKALHSQVTCPDCRRTHRFGDGVKSQPGIILIKCPLCGAFYSRLSVGNSTNA